MVTKSVSTYRLKPAYLENYDLVTFNSTREQDEAQSESAKFSVRQDIPNHSTDFSTPIY